jgi:hypothetical protein
MIGSTRSRPLGALLCRRSAPELSTRIAGYSHCAAGGLGTEHTPPYGSAVGGPSGARKRREAASPGGTAPLTLSVRSSSPFGS